MSIWRKKMNDLVSDAIASEQWFALPSEASNCLSVCKGWNGWAKTCYCGNNYPYFTHVGKTIEDLKLVVLVRQNFARSRG